MTKSVLGIIGGSGFYHLPGLENARWEKVMTPWGAPSDEILFAEHRRACRSASCPATGAATGSRRPASTSAPTSTP